MKHNRPCGIEIDSRASQRWLFDPSACATESPCTGCRYAITCRTRQLACEPFMQYLMSGQWKSPPPQRAPDRRPTMRLFRH